MFKLYRVAGIISCMVGFNALAMYRPEQVVNRPHSLRERRQMEQDNFKWERDMQRAVTRSQNPHGDQQVRRRLFQDYNTPINRLGNES